MRILRGVLAWVGLALAMCGLSLACGPTAAEPTPTPAADPFAVVRATAQAAYQAGQSELAAGNYLQACVDLDTAQTNDPDNRPEIQQALQQALAYCLTPPPTSTVAAAQRTIVVATVGVSLAGTLTAGNPASGPATPTAVAGAAAAGGTPTAGAVLATAGTPAATVALAPWNDPQGRFSVGAPSDWTRIDQPQTFIGTGVVGFHDPSGRAEADVAVDTSTKAVSPELYAASLEIAMQQQVPGYASEQIVPGSTAGNPSVRRVFTFMQRDASGQEHQARAFQVTIVKGSTPYVISGSAPADQYQQYSPAFDQIVESFRFS